VHILDFQGRGQTENDDPPQELTGSLILSAAKDDDFVLEAYDESAKI
jgi:hypothetical protein